MTQPISFFVPGIPKPGGSKRGFINPRTGRIIITEDCKTNKDWRASVVWMAKKAALGAADLLRGPLEFEFQFTMPRPRHHFRTGKLADQLRPDAPTFHTNAPDATKLTRSTEDALTGVLWADDAQVVQQFVSKRYGAQPGCRITVRPLVDAGANAPTVAQPSLL